MAYYCRPKHARFKHLYNTEVLGPLRARLGLRELRPHCLHPLATFGRFLPPVRSRINQFLEIGCELRCQSFADLAKQRLDLGEHSDMLAVRVIEKLEADDAVV